MERLTQIGIYFLVARLLGSSLFGQGTLSVAPALIAITVVQAYSQAISSEGLRGVANTTDIFMASLLFGVLGAIGCCVAGYFMAQAVGVPALMRLTAFASLAPICTSLGTVAEGIIIQRQQYRAMALRRIIGIIVAGTGAVLLAFNGFGALAIAFQTVVTSLCSTIACLIAARWLPHKRPSASGIAKAVHFSAPLMGSSGINMLTSRMSEVMLGSWLGPAASGQFRMAQSVVEIVSSVALAPVTSVFLPFLARAKDQAERAFGLDLVARRASIVMAAIALAGSIGSRGIYFVLPIVQWPDLATMISILALGLPMSAFLSLFQTYFIAERRPSLALYVNIFQNLVLATLLAGLMAVAPQPMSAAWANVGRLTAALIFVSYFRQQIYKLPGSTSTLKALLPIAGMIALVALTTLALRLLSPDLAGWVQNGIYVAAGGLMMLLFGLFYRDDIVQGVLGKAPASPASKATT
jgi:O-antigen/teichoic acid export membrane protein